MYCSVCKEYVAKPTFAEANAGKCYDHLNEEDK